MLLTVSMADLKGLGRYSCEIDVMVMLTLLYDGANVLDKHD